MEYRYFVALPSFFFLYFFGDGWSWPLKSDKERFPRCVITVLDLKYLKGEYLDYVRISFSLLLEYWMKRMVLCFFFSPDEKTNLQEEKKELYFVNAIT